MQRLVFSLTAAALAVLPAAALAQSYPSRVVRMVIPYGPGGPTDIVGRVLAQKLTESLGQQVIVENRLGAGGTVGTDPDLEALP